MLRREIYTKIFEACEIARFNEDKLIQFNKDMYDERRRNGELAAAIEEGMEKGLEKGREEGLKKGREEGLKKGREEGIAEGRAEAVRKMMAAGMSVEQVCTIMGMTAEEVRKTL